MDFRKAIPVDRPKKFVKFGGLYVDPDTIAVVSSYKGVDSAVLHIPGIEGTGFQTYMSVAETIKKIEEHYNS